MILNVSFLKSSKNGQIPTWYADPECIWSNLIIDYIVYDPNRLECIENDKAWDTPNHTLEKSLRIFGSDHIYIWATFRFRQDRT